MLTNTLKDTITQARRRVLLAAGSAAIALTLGACSGGETSAPAEVKTAPAPTEVSAGPSVELEKEQLRFGFIKLTDMAPLAIAYEKVCSTA